MTSYQASARGKENSGPLQRFLHSFTGYKKHFALVLMFLPVVAYFVVFKYVPMAGIMIAFKNYKIKQGIWGSAWADPLLANFTKAFNTPTFARSVTNTLAISGLKLLFGFPAPILLALMLNEVAHPRFKKTVQTITYLPHFLSWVVLAGMFQQLLSPNNGAVNAVLHSLFGRCEGSFGLLCDKRRSRLFRPSQIVKRRNPLFRSGDHRPEACRTDAERHRRDSCGRRSRRHAES